MTLQTPDTQAVFERLERLERQYRRLKQTGLIGLTAIAALVLMAQATPKSRTLETQELVLRDSSGKVRASFGAYRDGPKLTLNGEGGEKLAELFSGPDGSALTFFNRVGLPQTTLRADKTYFGLEIYSQDGKSRQAGLFGGQARPMLSLVDQHEKPRAVLSMEATGPQLVLTDDDGKPRLGMRVRDGSPLLQAEDANGNVTWSAPENTPSIAARPDKRPRVFIEVWKTAGMFRPELEPHTTEEMATFAQRCPKALVNIDRQKADYVLRLDRYYGYKDNQEQHAFRSLLLDSEGSQVGTGSVVSSLEDSLDETCKTLMGDWLSRNHAR